MSWYDIIFVLYSNDRNYLYSNEAFPTPYLLGLTSVDCLFLFYFYGVIFFFGTYADQIEFPCVIDFPRLSTI